MMVQIKNYWLLLWLVQGCLYVCLVGISMAPSLLLLHIHSDYSNGNHLVFLALDGHDFLIPLTGADILGQANPPSKMYQERISNHTSHFP